MPRTIAEIMKQALEVQQKALEQNQEPLARVVERVSAAFQDGRTLFICGNGGSAADSQHIAAEFIGRFQRERRALPAVALTTDSSILTCLSNDYSFETVFSRQVEALARPGDVLLGLSTSGNSPNVVKAFEAARQRDVYTISLTGEGGGKLQPLSDMCLTMPSKVTARIQEAYMTLAHILCELVEERIADGG
ncbi:MAG: D-sedoheptulose 7-phosphate isomerase [Candidatus Omnitrophota bacterium]